MNCMDEVFGKDNVTLTVLAQAFITMIRTDPKAHAPG
jgi:hypothetical protein